MAQFLPTYARQEQNKPIRNPLSVNDWTIRSRLQKMSANYKVKHRANYKVKHRGQLLYRSPTEGYSVKAFEILSN